MALVLLVRHGRTAANATGVLAGRTPGVLLDGVGEQQAAALAQRMLSVPVTLVVSSPLERTMATAEAMLSARPAPGPELILDERVIEAGYGDWTNRPISELTKEPLWRTVQQHPSAVTFPGGEAMPAMALRAVAAVREWAARVDAMHVTDPRMRKLQGEGVAVVVSHGDVIKAVLADALGMHLDQFQRIVVDPCSVSAIRYTPLRPFVLRSNDSSGSLAGLTAAPRPRRKAKPTAGAAGDSDADNSGTLLSASSNSDAVIGGGAG